MVRFSFIVRALLFVAVAMAAWPSQSAKPAKEERLLGAPCRGSYQLSPETWAARQTINRKHDVAIKQGDYDTAVALRKELVRYQCGNHFLWFYLAELYVELGNNDEAIAILEYLYDEKSNEVDRRLFTKGNALHPLVQSQPYQQSTLARRLSTDRDELAARNQQFRQELEGLGPERKPPALYIAKDACPFECCTFRTWDVLSEIVLYDRPDGQSVVGRVKKGEKVEGLTGDVHIRPIPVAVQYSPPYSDVPAGSIVFLLDHLGEGIGRVWHEGKVLELDVAGNIQQHCPFPDKDCWGEYIDPVTEDERWGTWWVKVQTQGGVVGWTQHHENFGNMDSCA